MARRLTLASPARWLTSAATWLARAVASEAFFYVIIAAFVLNAGFIALAAQYLMYDEYYHFGIVNVYAQQWSPFITDGSENFGLGDTERLPSYLFHYLLSFPLRVTQAAGADHFWQVVVLRFFDIAFVAASLYWLRKSLLLLGMSKALVQVSLAGFLAIPVVTFVAAHVNYDNLLLLAGSIFLYYAIRTFQRAEFAALDYVLLVMVGCFASVVKFTFLPIFAITMVILIGREIYRLRTAGLAERRESRVKLQLRRPTTWVAIGLLLVALALFIERIIGNYLMFGKADPDCDAVQTQSFCFTYRIYERNEALEAEHVAQPRTPQGFIVYFLRYWAPGLLRTVTVVGGETSHGPMTYAGTAGLVILVPILTAIAALIVTLGISAGLKNRSVVFMSAIVLSFALIVCWTQYGYILQFGLPLAIQSRYFILFLPFVCAAVVASMSFVLDRTQSSPVVWKAAFIVVALVVASQGAGALTFIAAATESWIAPESPWYGFYPALHDFVQTIVLGA